MELCRYAVRVQPEQPENYLNLASAYLLLGRRSEAMRALFQMSEDEKALPGGAEPPVPGWPAESAQRLEKARELSQAIDAELHGRDTVNRITGA